MASSGSFTGNRGVNQYGPYLRVDWEMIGTDATNNRSRIQAKVYLISTQGINFSASKSANITIDGHTRYFTYTGGMRSPATRYIGSHTRWVNHNANGYKTINISANLGIRITWSGVWLSNINASKNVSLDQVGGTSYLTNARYESGFRSNVANSIQFTLNRANSNYTHDFRLTRGNTTIASWNNIGTTSSLSLSTSQSNTIYNYMNNTGNVDTVLRVTTKLNGSTIGSREYNLVAKIHSSLHPKINFVNYHNKQTGNKSFLQNAGNLTYSVNVSTGSGASINRYRVVLHSQDKNDWKELTTQSGTFNPMTQTGSYTFVVYAYDTRGLYDRVEYSLNVSAYSRPTLWYMQTYRGNSPSDFNYNQDRVTVSFQVNYNSATSINVRIERKKRGTSTTYASTPNLSGANPQPVSQTFNIPVTESWDFKIIVTDSAGTTITHDTTIGSARPLMTWNKNEGVGIGKNPDKGVLLDIDDSAPVHIGGSPLIESGSNANGNYIKLYDGTLICWMVRALRQAQPWRADSSVTFPIAYDHPRNISVTATMGHPASSDYQGSTIHIRELSATGMNVHIYRGIDSDSFPNGSIQTVYIMVVGRWK